MACVGRRSAHRRDAGVGAAPITPAPAAEGTPRPRLRLDIDGRVKERLDRDPPRFELEVVGTTPQAALEQHLKSFDVLCGASDHGAPTLLDMAGQRPGPSASVRLDQLLGPLLLGAFTKLKKSGPDRYFVYRVSGPNGAHFLMREGPIPEPQRFVPGGVIELVIAYPDRKAAAHAWRRLERGFGTPEAVLQRNPCAPR
jgi:hypothetical protein